MSRKANNNLRLLLGIFLMLSATLPSIGATLCGLCCEPPIAASCCSDAEPCCHLDEAAPSEDARETAVLLPLVLPVVVPSSLHVPQPLTQFESATLPEPRAGTSAECIGHHPARAPPVR
jgi:hypothetical protein